MPAINAPDPLAEPTLRLIKQGSHRNVYRHDGPQGNLYIKHYKTQGWLKRLAHWLWPDAAWREWTASRTLAALAIPCANAVAYGELSHAWLPGDRVLALDAISNAAPLNVWGQLHAQARPRARRQAARQVGKFLALLHRSGVWHGDLHAGNLLVQETAGHAAPLVFLIDLAEVKFRSPLAWPAACQSLAMFWSGCQEFSSAAEQRVALHAYLQDYRPHGLPQHESAVLAQLEATRAKHAKRVLSGRDRRAWAENRDFRRRTCGAWQSMATADFPLALLDELVRTPETLLKSAAAAPLKWSYSSVVERLSLAADVPRNVILKCYRPKQLWKAWLANRAKRNWHWGHALQARGIRVPRPLALLWKRGWLPSRASYLLTEPVEPSENLHLLVQRASLSFGRATDADIALRAELLHLARQAGTLVGQIHYWGFLHRDLKLCNFVVRLDNTTQCHAAAAPGAAGDMQVPRAGTLYLVDLDGVRRVRPGLKQHQRARDLRRLAQSLTDCLQPAGQTAVSHAGQSWTADAIEQFKRHYNLALRTGKTAPERCEATA